MPIRPVLLGLVAVLVLDTAGSFAARAFGFEYGLLALVSAMIYGATGYVVARRADRRAAVRAGAILGSIDATLGWGISWLIGPGRLPADQPGGPLALVVGGFVAIGLATCCAAIGGWISSRRPPSRPAAA